MVDTLPVGLTALSETGTGWLFSVVGQTVTATTSTAIAPLSSAPVITLTVAVGANAGSVLVNTASVSATGAISSSVTDTTTFVLPPTNFTAKVRKCVYLSQTDRINSLHWTPSASTNILEYILYRNGFQIDVIAGSGPYYYNDHNRNKNIPDVYTLIAVDIYGQQSLPASVTVQ